MGYYTTAVAESSRHCHHPLSSHFGASTANAMRCAVNVRKGKHLLSTLWICTCTYNAVVNLTFQLCLEDQSCQSVHMLTTISYHSDHCTAPGFRGSCRSSPLRVRGLRSHVPPARPTNTHKPIQYRHLTAKWLQLRVVPQAQTKTCDTSAVPNSMHQVGRGALSRIHATS